MHQHPLVRLAVLLLLAVAASTATARGGHGHGHGHGHFRGSVGFYFDDPYYWGGDPFYYPY